MGVSRRDARELRAELRGELEAVLSDGLDTVLVTGPDVGSFARAWVAEREDVRLTGRYAMFVTTALVGLFAGAAIAAGFIQLAQFAARVAVDNGAYDLFGSAGGRAILAAYLATGATAYGGAIVAARWSLTRWHDPSAGTSVRALAIALPAAGVLATGAAVGLAASSGYSATTKYITAESLLALTIVVLAILAARWFAVGRQRRRRAVATP